MKFCRLFNQETNCLGRKIILHASNISVLKAEDGSWEVSENIYCPAFTTLRFSF